MNITKNFTMAEMIKSQTASRRGFDNTPGTNEVINLVYLAQRVLQPVRDIVGPIIVSSGYRSNLVNNAIGSGIYSQHTLGQAVDIESIDPDISTAQLGQYIIDNIPEFDQLILEHFDPSVDGDPKSGWVHVSYQNPDLGYSPNRNERLMTYDSNGVVSYKTVANFL
jgi:hypothetical protein